MRTLIALTAFALAVVAGKILRPDEQGKGNREVDREPDLNESRRYDIFDLHTN